MIDIHCHLNFHKFEADYDEVVKRAHKKGVTKIVNVGTSIETSAWAVKLAEQYDDLWAIVGVHPHHADKLTKGRPELGPDLIGIDSVSSNAVIPDQIGDQSDNDSHFRRNDNYSWIKELERIATHPKVIGIGEIGMDYYSYASNGVVNPALQKEVFEAQIELAHRLQLPLQIHHRQVGQELIDILKHHKNLLLPVPGMFHCFAGSKEFLKQALDLGFYIGFDGNSTYKGIAKGETVELSELIKLTPLDRIVTETDSPYLTPEPHRGTRNEPSYVILVGEFLARIKEIPFETLVDQTTKNSHTIFTKLNPKL